MTSHNTDQSMSSFHSILRMTFKMAVSIKVNLNLRRSEVTYFEFVYMNVILSKICYIYNVLRLLKQFYFNGVNVKSQYLALSISLLFTPYIVLLLDSSKCELKLSWYCNIHQDFLLITFICSYNIIFFTTILVKHFQICQHSLFIIVFVDCAAKTDNLMYEQACDNRRKTLVIKSYQYCSFKKIS